MISFTLPNTEATMISRYHTWQKHFASFMHAIKPLIPIPALLAIVPALWWFFRDTWRELDEDAQRYRGMILDAGKAMGRERLYLPAIGKRLRGGDGLSSSSSFTGLATAGGDGGGGGRKISGGRGR